jgi:hypothetical protein
VASRSATAAAVAICLALSLAVAAAASADPLVFRVSDQPATRSGSSALVAPVAPGFAGVSMDYCAITKYTGSRPNPVLARLLLNVAPTGPLIRIGGNGPDQMCSATARPITLAPAAIAAIARRTRAKLILGIDLEAHNIARVQSEVAALVQEIGPRSPSKYIDAFEIGNEPDLYPAYGPSVAGPATGPYFRQYLSDFTQWGRVIRQVAGDPGIGIAGPSLGRLGMPWITGPRSGNLGTFVNGPALPAPITFHTYPLLGTTTCPGSTCPTVPNLLLNRFSHDLAEQLVPFVLSLGPYRQLRVDEMNSVTMGGAAGVSNTFASALWMLDTMFEYLHAGISGVNVHTFPSANYALYSGPGPGGWRVFPEYYGMLAFASAAPAGAQLLDVIPGISAHAAPAVKVWATQALDGTRTAVVINKSTEAHVVVLHGSGIPSKASAKLAFLQAPPTAATTVCPAPFAAAGLCATSGVTLGGASFGPRSGLGGDQTRTGSLRAPPPGLCTRLVACTTQRHPGGLVLVLPPGSAALVTTKR